jgi:hydroxymethylpyrimidine/phosphomethylpyrimidine kinase
MSMTAHGQPGRPAAHGRPPVALSIAGSDPSGGAGVQADLKAFLDGGAYGAAVITALTVQSTRGVAGWMPVPSPFIVEQIRHLLADISPDCVKIGMIGTAEIAAAVAQGLEGYDGPVILDPVMVATSGDVLLQPDAEAALRERLFPRATLITPNLPEARRLWGDTPAAEAAKALGVAVLLKDGHNTLPVVEDALFMPDGHTRSWAHPRVATRNTHGTGCTLSSAIAARVARGEPLEEAVGGALDYVARLIAYSAHHDVGGGCGPLLHGFVG